MLQCVRGAVRRHAGRRHARAGGHALSVMLGRRAGEEHSVREEAMTDENAGAMDVEGVLGAPGEAGDAMDSAAVKAVRGTPHGVDAFMKHKLTYEFVVSYAPYVFNESPPAPPPHNRKVVSWIKVQDLLDVANGTAGASPAKARAQRRLLAAVSGGRMKVRQDLFQLQSSVYPTRDENKANTVLMTRKVCDLLAGVEQLAK